jgi:hypothetical protein
MERQAGCKFYFSPATVKPGSETTSKADMLSSEWVWADLDPRGGKPLEAERTEMLTLLTTDLPIDVARPTFIVDSGRGYWAFWRLEAPHVFDGRDGDATRSFEAVLRGLANAFGEFGDRSVKNINRIARLPSSINPKTNVVAKVIDYNNARYTLRDFPVIAIERKARADSADDAVPLDVFKRMLAATPYIGGPAGHGTGCCCTSGKMILSPMHLKTQRQPMTLLILTKRTLCCRHQSQRRKPTPGPEPKKLPPNANGSGWLRNATQSSARSARC